MALIHRDRFGLDWPERWRRAFDFDWEGGAWLRLEELNEDGTFVVRAELPGIDPDRDVELTVLAGVLRIRAERRETSEHEGREGFHSEFHYGAFVRDVTLPEGASVDDVDATYRDGILEVRIPVPGGRKVAATKVPVTRM